MESPSIAPSALAAASKAPAPARRRAIAPLDTAELISADALSGPKGDGFSALSAGQSVGNLKKPASLPDASDGTLRALEAADDVEELLRHVPTTWPHAVRVFLTKTGVILQLGFILGAAAIRTCYGRWWGTDTYGARVMWSLVCSN